MLIGGIYMCAPICVRVSTMQWVGKNPVPTYVGDGSLGAKIYVDLFDFNFTVRHVPFPFPLPLQSSYMYTRTRTLMRTLLRVLVRLGLRL